MSVKQSPPDRSHRPLLEEAIPRSQRCSRQMFESMRGYQDDFRIERADHFNVVADVIRFDDIDGFNDVLVVVPAKSKGRLAAFGRTASVRIFGLADGAGARDRGGKC